MTKPLKVLSYRPGVIANGTAFEAMALIYKYLQNNYGWEFTIMMDDRDTFEDSELNIITIPYDARAVINRTSFLKKPLLFKKQILNKYKDKFDFILGCDPTVYNQGMQAAVLSRSWDIPLAFDSSLTLMGQANSINWRLKRKQVVKALEQSSIIWLTAPKAAERFRDLGLSKEQISKQFVILGHPVDTDLFSPAEVKKKQSKEKVILCVARLVMEKGVHYIIEAVAPIMKMDDNVKLKIIGSGESKKFLENMVKDEGLEDQIEFLDPIPHHELPALYRKADLFVGHPVSTSKWEEYFGVVNVEAMASGLPVVSSNSGGITHLAREKEVAILVNERDIISTTNAIELLLYDEDKYQEIKRKGREYVLRQYSLPVIAEKYRKYIEAAME
ncbi:glycosyltransferase [Aquibacillus kalidii]|uniref:glycosyltransferase n=1 Tax=Aquibacillus kalidii TaxID=2762597 RepID=UPI0016493AB1|nr:glycosyltransferase [Aquibacillus kalidii]